MITSAEIQLIRDEDPGAIPPGIDTPTGNPLPVSSLLSYTKINNPGYYYNATNNTVFVTQNGAVLSGINFGTAAVEIQANNVTIKDCTFTGTTGYWAINQNSPYSGGAVENCTFQGSGSPTETNVWISAGKSITIEDNSFLDSPTDAIDMTGGLVTGNYFSGAGFAAGAHADAIWVPDSTSPTIITDNFIDGTYTASAAANANSDLRLTTEGGNLSNVTVSGNYLLGAGFTVEVAYGPDSSYTISNVSVTNNYIGFNWYGPYYPGTQNNANIAGNTIVSYADPALSAQALAAYEKTIIEPTHVIAATTAGQVLTSSASTPTTLLGKGLATLFNGSSNETNFVGGFGGQRMLGGAGANIFTYLAVSDSSPHDTLSGVDPAKDVFDFSRIDANITTPGLQHFTFIGTAPFSGAGAQVRYQLDPAGDITYVEFDLAGDSTADFTLWIVGLVPLTAANFALTPAQSVADLANGAALVDTKVQTPAGGMGETAYTNVKGQSYSSYESFWASIGGYAVVAAEDLNLSSTTDELRLFEPSLTVSRSGGAETIQYGTGAADPLSYHSVQTIDATTDGPETFVFGANFGHETIQGFAASGSTPDTIQLATSSFSYLTAGMTQAQDLAAVLANASNGPSGLTITDSHGDSLTLAGLKAATIAANPSAIKFA